MEIKKNNEIKKRRKIDEEGEEMNGRNKHKSGERKDQKDKWRKEVDKSRGARKRIQKYRIIETKRGDRKRMREEKMRRRNEKYIS